MPETIIIDAPAADVDKLRYQESADGLTGWAQIGDDIPAAGLPADPGGGQQVVVATGDPAKFARLMPVSASGIERASDAAILPPRPADPATFTVYIDTVDLGMGEVDGLAFAVMPSGQYAKAGEKLGAAVRTVKTGDVPWQPGHAELTPPANAGEIRITLTRTDARATEKVIEVTVDTTDRNGQVLNFVDLLPA